MCCLYIYIDIIRGTKYLTFSFVFVVLWDYRKTTKTKENAAVIRVKTRTIKSGETPQKSLILPPVHTFTKVLVTPLNLIFSYFLRISGGVKITTFMIFDENCKKL